MTPLNKWWDEMPIPQVFPVKQTRYEKRMAKLMNQLIDYTYNQAKATKIIKTPFGVLMWTPKS